MKLPHRVREQVLLQCGREIEPAAHVACALKATDVDCLVYGTGIFYDVWWRIGWLV